MWQGPGMLEAPGFPVGRFPWALLVYQSSPGSRFRVFEQSGPVAPSGGAFPADGAGSGAKVHPPGGMRIASSASWARAA